MSNRHEHHSHDHQHRGKSSERFLDKGQVLAALDIAPGQTILDAGCGNGYMAKAFAELAGAGGHVYALDPDIEIIDALAAEVTGENFTALVDDITGQTALEAGAFDLIYISTVLHGFSAEDMAGFRDEVRRLLKPGGKLAVVEFKKEATEHGPPHDIRISAEELELILDMTPLLTEDLGALLYLQVFTAQPFL